MQFPSREADIIDLGHEIIDGFERNTDIYTDPPHQPAEIQSLLDIFLSKRDTFTQLDAQKSQAVHEKQDALFALTDAMKDNLRYAENKVDYDDALLKLIGWGGRAEPQALQVPGQPRELTAPKQGGNWAFLDWKRPLDGGAPVNYLVYRRKRPAGDWELVGQAWETEKLLTNQKADVEWEYAIVAANKAGESEKSNIVMVKL